MELNKGVCFCCDSDKVIVDFEHKKVHKIISSLFSNDLLNVDELDRVLSYLEICPLCYHKLLILGRTSENLKSGFSSSPNRKCIMCRGGDVLFYIAKWPHLKTISQDVGFKHEPKFQMCSDCLFYLDVRYTFKETIFSKYPELKPKLKLKIQNVVPSPSILKVENGKTTKKFKRLRFSDIDESIDSPITTPVIDLSAIQVFRPLKYNRSIKKSNLNKDPKFINQIPYVLLEESNLRPYRENVISEKLTENDLEEEVITTSSPAKGLKIKLKFKRKKLGKQLSKENIDNDLTPTSFETVLQKYDFKKDLIVNLPKIIDTNNKFMKRSSLMENSNIPSDNCHDVLDQNAKSRLSEFNNDKEYSRNTRTDIVKSKSDQLDISPKHKRHKPKPLSKQKNIIVMSNESIQDTGNDERSGDLENSNIAVSDETNITVELDRNDVSANIESNDEETQGSSPKNVEDNDNLGGDKKVVRIKKLRIKRRRSLYVEEDSNNCLDSKDDTKNIGEKDSSNSDEILDSSTENEDAKRGIKKLRIKRRKCLYVEEENGDNSESDGAAEDNRLNVTEAEISPEKTVDITDVEDKVEDVGENVENVEDNVEEVESNTVDVEDKRDVEENVENVEDNVEEVELNKEHVEENVEDDKLGGDEKAVDLTSDKTKISAVESVKNTEKVEIGNNEPIEEETSSASNIAQPETISGKTDTDVDDGSDETKNATGDKETIEDIISFLEDSRDKTLDKEGKSDIDTFEDKDDGSNSSASKRKYEDDDDVNTNDSADKKKKKVTFSEDVLLPVWQRILNYVQPQLMLSNIKNNPI